MSDMKIKYEADQCTETARWVGPVLSVSVVSITMFEAAKPDHMEFAVMKQRQPTPFHQDS